jgi:hypothetical protein
VERAQSAGRLGELTDGCCTTQHASDERYYKLRGVPRSAMKKAVVLHQAPSVR